MNLEKENIRMILLKDYNYHESQVDKIVDQLLAMDPAILDAFETFLTTHEMPTSPVFYGSAPANLAATYPQKPPSIFLLLDWIRSDRVSAYAALQDEYHILPEPLPLKETQSDLQDETNL